MIIYAESQLLWRCWKSLFNMGDDYRKFRYRADIKKWCLGNFPIGKDLPECLDNLRYLEKKHNDIK